MDVKLKQQFIQGLMMANTTNLIIPLMAGAQSQKYVTFNEAMQYLDVLTQGRALDKDLSAPPGSPADGDVYIISTSPTGAWASKDWNITAYLDGVWRFFPPKNGWMMFVVDESRWYYFNSSWGWLPAIGALSVKNTGDTNDSSSGSGSDHDHSLTFTLPASFLTSGKTLRVTNSFRISTGSAAPTLAHKLKAGATTIGATGAQAPANNITNDSFAIQWLIQALAAPGGTANVDTSLISVTGAAISTVNSSSTNQPVALATNGTLALTISTLWATAGTGTNTIQQMQFIVEALN